MTEPRTFAYVSQGLRLNVCEWGDPAAPPLVLLHGVRDHARAWDPVAQTLAPRFRVLAPDLRGHGDSEHARGGFYPTEGYVYDLAELFERERLAPAVIVGHSLGGNIGLRYAGLFPDKVRAIAAIEGLSHSPKLLAQQRAIAVETRLRDWIARQREIAARPARRYASLAEAVTRVAGEHPRLDPEFAAHLARHGVRDNGDGTVSFKFDPALRAFPPVEMPAEDVWRLWSLVACPVLLVYGAQSWASNPVADGRARHFAKAEVTTLEDAGHWAHHDQRAAFLEVLLRFLP
ncbi:MAG: alpha/beta hydrolase [Pseudomonadota bacterium]|nr:alpha/beta hydrolase [Pseudomonadota bacterium]